MISISSAMSSLDRLEKEFEDKEPGIEVQCENIHSKLPSNMLDLPQLVTAIVVNLLHNYCTIQYFLKEPCLDQTSCRMTSF